MDANIMKKHKIFETQRAPGFLFDALSKAYSVRTNKVIKPFNLTATEWPVLDQIYLHKGINQKELAQYCLKDPSTIVKTLDHLEKKGLIVRQPDEKDRRAFKIIITEKGISCRQEAYQATRELFEKVTETLSQNDIDQLYDICIRIFIYLQELDQQKTPH